MRLGFKKQLGVGVCLLLAILLLVIQPLFAQDIIPTPQVTGSTAPGNTGIPPGLSYDINPSDDDDEGRDDPLNRVNANSPVLPAEILQAPPADDPPMADLDEVDKAVPTVAENLAVWSGNRIETAQDLLEMRDELLNKLESAVANTKEDDLEDFIKQGNMFVKRPNIGRMKITLLKQAKKDGSKGYENVPVSLFFENKTGLAIILTEAGEVDLKSREYRSMVAGLHVEGGDDYKGRDVVSAVIRTGGEIETTYHPRLKFSDWREWGRERLLYYHRPSDRNDIVVGSGSAIINTVATAATSELVSVVGTHVFGVPTPFEWKPAITSFGFSAPMIPVSRTYSNFAEHKRLSATQQMIRSFPLTYTFNCIYLLWGHDFTRFLTLGFQAESIFQIQINKQLVSRHWIKWRALRTDLRENSGRLRVTWWNMDFALRKDQIERAKISLIPMTFKSFDFILSHFVHFHVLGHVVHPILPVFQVIGAGLASLHFLKYKYHLAHREVSDTWTEEKSLAMKELYENSFTPRLWNVWKNDKKDVPGFLWDTTVDTLGEQVDDIKSTCNVLLRFLRLKAPEGNLSILQPVTQ